MKLRKKCIILDHDDTVIDSQESIHYPLFVAVLKELRPHVAPISFEQFIDLSNKLGFTKMCRLVYHFTPDEILYEYEHWKKHVEHMIAPTYAGLESILQRFVQAGGIIVVYTMNAKHNVLNDYARLFNMIPHAIIAHDQYSILRKPYRLSLLQTLSDLNVSVKDCVFVDDSPLVVALKDRLNIEFLAASWAKSAHALWESNTDVTVLYHPEQLAHYLFDVRESEHHENNTNITL